MDVFFDDLVMSHTIRIRRRLDELPDTIPGSDLLLSKLQIHDITLNDLFDLMAIMVGISAEEEKADHMRLEEVLRDDWGFWHTVNENLVRLREEAAKQQTILGQEGDLLQARTDRFAGALARTSKTMRWRLRARVGTRTRWYEEVGEVDRERA
ncbi:MAG: hypothetical protein ACRDVP_06550 [Acidimicrobiales bacterium]